MTSLPSWSTKALEILGLKTALPWSTGEIHGPCPKCHGKDRFIIWETGGAWCRQCQFKTSWKSGGSRQGKSREQIAKGRAAALGMYNNDDWLLYYHNAMSDRSALELWQKEGMPKESVMRWGLGYCHQVPTYPQSPSLTIPVWGNGRLLDIRHKLLNTNPISGKYRSHLSGIGLIVNLFNRDALRVRNCVIVEGEKKAIVLEDHGISACGIYGSGGTRELISIAKRTPLSIIVALDPDVEEQAWKLSSDLIGTGASVKIAHFPMKPDDFLLKYGIDVTNEILRQAMRVNK